MPKNKNKLCWFVNILSFLLFLSVACTGIITMHLKGEGHNRGVINSKHIITEIHEVTAILFIIIVIVHLILHIKYIKNNLFSNKKTSCDDEDINAQ